MLYAWKLSRGGEQPQLAKLLKKFNWHFYANYVDTTKEA